MRIFEVTKPSMKSLAAKLATHRASHEADRKRNGKPPLPEKPKAVPLIPLDPNAPVDPSKAWATQQPNEWVYSDGSPVLTARGLPIGFFDLSDGQHKNFIKLPTGLDNKFLRLFLMKHRYSTPVYA